MNLDELERDPEFAKLSYAEQTQLRGEMYFAQASKDPDWGLLQDAEKETLITEYVRRPPVFENPQVGKEAQALLDELKSGDSTGRARAIFEGTAGNFLPLRVWSAIQYLRPKYLPILGEQDKRDAIILEGSHDSLYGRDGAKFREWSASVNPGHGLARFVGAAGGVMGSLLMWKALPFMKVAQAGATEAISNFAASTTIRSQAVKGILGNFATNTLEAIGLTAGNMVEKVWDEGGGKWNLEEVAKTYGENAIIDYAIGTVTGVVWPFAKLTGKALGEVVLPRGKGSVTKDIISDGDVDRFIANAITGDLPLEVSERLPAFYADQTRALKEMGDLQKAIGRDAALLNESPFYRASVTARMAGMELGIDEAGLPNLRKIDDVMNNVDSPRTFKSMGDVHEAIAEDLATLIENHPKKFKVADYGPEAPLIQGVLTRRGVLSTLPETRGMTPAPKRDYVTGTEASSLLTSSADRAFLVRVGEEGVPVGALVRDPAGNAMAIVTKVATPSETEIALKAAMVQKAQNPLLKESVRDMRLDSLRRAGYDAATLPDGTTFSLYKGNVRPIREIGEAKGIGKGVSGSSEAGFDTFMNVETRKMYKDAELARDPRKASALISGRGDLDAPRVGRYAEVVLQDMGKADVKVRVEGVEGISKLDATLNGDVLSVRMPTSIPMEGRRDALRTLMKTLKDVEPGSKVPRRFSASASRALRKVEIPGDTFDAKRAWAAANVEKLAGRRLEDLGGGKFKIAEREFESLDAVADYLVTSRLTPDVVRASLAEEGLKWSGKRGAYTVTDAGGNVIAKGASVTEVLGEMGWRPKRIPSELMPEVAVVEGGAEITQTKAFVTGSYPKLMRYMDRFENFKLEEEKRVLARVPDAMMLALPTRKFEVVVPGAGIRETFGSAKEASWFLRGGWAQYEGVKRVAARKGLDLSVEKGAYVARVGGETLTAEFGDKKALAKLLKRLPDPQTLPSLIGEEAEALMRKHGIELGEMGPLFNPSNPPSFSPTRTVGPLSIASSLYPTPLTKWIENGLRSTGHPELLNSFDKLVDRFRVFNSEHTKWRRLIRETISPNGKTLSDKKLVGLRWWMEADTPAKKAGIIEEYKLNDVDLGVGERLRDIWGRNPGDGLYGLFGIDPFKYQTDYIPRLKRAVADMKDKGIALEPENIFAHAFPKGPPAEIKFFAEMDRLSEMLNFDAEDNVAALMDRYVTQGLKKHYLNPVWREFDAARRSASRAGNFDTKVLNPAIDSWRETVMGYKTPGEKAVEHFSERFLGKLGVKNPAFTKDITRTLFTAQAFGTMAWKGWNVTRNMAQIYTTFGSTYGITEATRAMREVAENAARHIGDAKRRGILLDTPPLINSIIDERSLVGRIVHKGLAGFTASDDFTRTAAMVGGDHIFDDALAKLTRGVLKSPEDFITYSKAYRFSEGAQRELISLIEEGKYAGARDLFARNVIDDTMFAYDKIHNPKLYQGVLGRLIGQYGVFAVQYIQNVKKGLTMGPLADRIAYGTRLAAVNAALLYTAKSLGVKADRDFLPWSPAQFTGGPMFNLVLDVWGSQGEGYQADQARARLAKSLPVGWTHKNGRFEWTGPQVPGGPLGTLVPFAAQFRALNKASEYLEKGEPWLAFLAVTSTPIVDEYRR